MTWTSIDKAQWILEHGEPKVLWIYERVDANVYRRPIDADNVPPWVSPERELVYNLDEGKQ